MAELHKKTLKAKAAVAANKGREGIMRKLAAKKKPHTPPKPVYEGRGRIAIPHGKRSDKMESKATKIGGRANAAQTAGKGKQAGKLAAKAMRFHGKADKASAKYQAKQAKTTPVLRYVAS